jgi:tetratricopeptide (TPR) repeat protein
MPARKTGLLETRAVSVCRRRIWAAREGSPVRLLLEGERGVGKQSSVIQALQDHPFRNEIVILRGAADQFRAPFSPLIEAFTNFIQEHAGDTAVRRVALEVARDLSGVKSWPVSNSRQTKALPPEAGYGYPPSEAADLVFRIFKAIRLIGDLSHPILVFFDVNRYDSSTLSLLLKLARRTDVDVSYILTSDLPEESEKDAYLSFTAELTSRLNFSRIVFSRFTLDETHAFLDHALGAGAAGEFQVQALHKKTGGNPLFLRELLEHLEDEGYVVEKNGKRELLDTFMSATLPANIRNLIDLKLRTLPAELREIIEIASVIGNTFNHQPISETLNLEQLLVLGRLRRLELAHRLVEQMESAHRFSLEVIRDTVYESLGSAITREHHLMLARYFERHREHPDVHYLLFHHYDRAKIQEKARENLIRSAYAARNQLSHEEAAYRFHLAKSYGLRSVDASLEKQYDLTLEEAISYFLAGDFGKALKLLEEVSSSTNLPLRARSLLYTALSEYLLDRPEKAIVILGELFEGFAAALDKSEILKARLTRASVLYALGLWDEGKSEFLECLRESRHRDAICVADVVKRGNMFFYPELALGKLRQAEKWLADRNDLPLRWEIHHNIGCNYLLMGDLDRAEIYLREALERFDSMGTYKVSYSINNLGLVEMFRGNYDAARNHFRRVQEVARVDFDRMTAICHIGILTCLCGETEAAIPILERLRDEASSMSEMILVDLIFHNLAWAYSLAGRREEAMNALLSSPPTPKNLWSEFRIARRQRMLANLSGTNVAAETDSAETQRLARTGRLDSWSFKRLDYEVNDLWFWE